ncbi:MAG: hypothetical protein KC561_20070, partial [Myxococcales bacterium]|nr:hypothetical protein [Myxococcales bacterium]
MTDQQAQFLDMIPKLINPETVRTHLELGSKFQKFLSGCLTGRTLRDVYRVTGLTRRQTFAVIFALRDTGYLEFRKPKTAEESRRQAVETFVSQKASDIGRVDHFRWLGVHWTAGAEEILQAVDVIHDKLHTLGAASISPETTRLVNKVVAHLNIVASLTDPNHRRQYRRTVVDGFEFEQAVLFLEQQLTTAKVRGDSREVHQQLDKLRELDPRRASRMSQELASV